MPAGWIFCDWSPLPLAPEMPPRPGSGKGRGITKPPLKKRRKRR